MDRLFDLPEFILHQMLSFLPYGEAARTSVLSKRWYSPWLSYPVRYFYIAPGDDLVEKERCMKVVDNSLLRFSKQGLRMQKFHLRMNDLDSESASLIDKWVRLLFEMDVQDLRLDLYDIDSEIFYRLPETICLERPYCRHTRLYHLQKLALYHLELNQKFIEDVIRHCPSLCHFMISGCFGLKAIRVSKPLKLETLKLFLSSRVKVERVDIEAPNLQDLDLSADTAPGFTMNLTECQSLRKLHLKDLLVTARSFNSHVSCFHFLEVLILEYVHVSGRIKISCPHLKKFILQDLRGELVELKFDAP